MKFFRNLHNSADVATVLPLVLFFLRNVLASCDRGLGLWGGIQHVGDEVCRFQEGLRRVRAGDQDIDVRASVGEKLDHLIQVEEPTAQWLGELVQDHQLVRIGFDGFSSRLPGFGHF